MNSERIPVFWLDIINLYIIFIAEVLKFPSLVTLFVLSKVGIER